MHDLGYVHRDLKPANIMLGLGRKEHLVYLIDFGLTKKLTAVSLGYTGMSQMARKMAGTPIYSSINAHLATGGTSSLSYLTLLQRCTRKTIWSP